MLARQIILSTVFAHVLATPLASTNVTLIDCDAEECGGTALTNPDNGHLSEIARQMGLDPHQKCLYWRILENHGGMCVKWRPGFGVVACHNCKTQTPPWSCS